MRVAEKPVPPSSTENVVAFSPKQKRPALYSAKLPEKCWRGVFSAFRDTYSSCTEACDEFLFSGCLTTLSCVLGRCVKIATSFRVYANTYIVNVGPSGRSRKSTAQDFAEEVIDGLDSRFVVLPGIGSPEGLLKIMQEHPNVLISVNELKIILAKGAQEATRGLIPRLVEMYDCKNKVSLPNKKDPLTVLNPCLLIAAATTREWLHEMELGDVHGGLANRFLYFTGTDKEPIALPPPRDQSKFNNLLFTLHTLQKTYPYGFTKELAFSDAARRFYEPWYHDFKTAESESEILDIVGQRRHTHAMKLALIYAAMDGTGQIELDHIEAGCAFSDHQKAMHAIVFEGFNDSVMAAMDRSIMSALRAFGRMKVYQLRRKRPRIDAELLLRRLEALKKTKEVVYVAQSDEWEIGVNADEF